MSRRPLTAGEMNWRRSQSAARTKPLRFTERFFFFWKGGFRYLCSPNEGLAHRDTGFAELELPWLH
jgi:hypothetical protein